MAVESIINPFLHSGTLYSTGGRMHKGVNSSKASYIEKYKSVIKRCQRKCYTTHPQLQMRGAMNELKQINVKIVLVQYISKSLPYARGTTLTSPYWGSLESMPLVTKSQSHVYPLTVAVVRIDVIN